MSIFEQGGVNVFHYGDSGFRRCLDIACVQTAAGAVGGDFIRMFAAIRVLHRGLETHGLLLNHRTLEVWIGAGCQKLAEDSPAWKQADWRKFAKAIVDFNRIHDLTLLSYLAEWL